MTNITLKINNIKSTLSNNINLKKAWCVTACTDDYVYGCLRFAQRQKWLKSKYPTIVVLTNNISKDKIKLLEENDIEYQILKFNNRKANSNDYSELTLFNLLAPIQIKNYDLLCVLDADILAKKNIDLYLESANLTSDSFSVELNELYYPSLTVYFCKHNLNLYNKLIEFYNSNININNQEEGFLQEFLLVNKDYINNIINLKIHHNINKHCINQICSTINIFHFAGRIKPWNNKFNFLYLPYTQYNYTDFNNFIDINKSIIECFNSSSIIYNFFNFGNNISNIKDNFYNNKNVIKTNINCINTYINTLIEKDY